MLQSKLFTKTKKEVPADEVSKNAILLTRAGYIYKEMAGVYSYLPLGLRVLNNIVRIIREEMNAIGGQELVMTALQDKTIWEKTDRFDDAKVDNWFKTTLKNGAETGLAITHEEPLTRIMSEYVASYRDLPVLAYQFQNKFRNETRAKSGIMRGREFMMKDLYSFAPNEAEHKKLYAAARDAYIKIFNRVGLGEVTHITFASGGIFSKFSEEFQTVSEAGEDIIYVDSKSGQAVNKEVLTDEVLAELSIDRSNLVEKKSIESGNIFTLGTKFSEALGLSYTNEGGESLPVFMGSYGIGPTRLMGTLVEVMADEKGIVWPKEVAPFAVHIIALGTLESAAYKQAADIYRQCNERGIEALFDDRDLRAGEKFADSDLIGIPLRVVVSDKTLAEGKVEGKERRGTEARLITPAELFFHLETTKP